MIRRIIQITMKYSQSPGLDKLINQTTAFKTRNSKRTQPQRKFLLHKRNKKYLNIGKRSMPLRNNLEKLVIYHHIPSMMDHPLPLEHLIMAISLQER